MQEINLKPHKTLDPFGSIIFTFASVYIHWRGFVIGWPSRCQLIPTILPTKVGSLKVAQPAL